MALTFTSQYAPPIGFSQGGYMAGLLPAPIPCAMEVAQIMNNGKVPEESLTTSFQPFLSRAMISTNDIHLPGFDSDLQNSPEATQKRAEALWPILPSLMQAPWVYDYSKIAAVLKRGERLTFLESLINEPQILVQYFVTTSTGFEERVDLLKKCIQAVYDMDGMDHVEDFTQKQMDNLNKWIEKYATKKEASV